MALIGLLDYTNLFPVICTLATIGIVLFISVTICTLDRSFYTYCEKGENCWEQRWRLMTVCTTMSVHRTTIWGSESQISLLEAPENYTVSFRWVMQKVDWRTSNLCFICSFLLRSAKIDAQLRFQTFANLWRPGMQGAPHPAEELTMCSQTPYSAILEELAPENTMGWMTKTC
jgi:hypothetical protein